MSVCSLMTMVPGVVSRMSASCGSTPAGNWLAIFDVLYFTGIKLTLRHDGRGLDVIELGKLFYQIGVPFALDAALLRPATARRALAVAAEQAIDDVHPRYHLTERRKALGI